MGRYTTVQTYSDTNPMVVKLPYDEAAKNSSAAALEAGLGSADTDKHGAGYTVEKVNNVMGSTAGAGSGDFHHYRHTRRRELLRIEHMDKAAEEAEADESFAARVQAKRKECEERTRKNAEKRRRKRHKRNAEKEKAAEGQARHEAEEEVDNGRFSYTPLHLDSDNGATTTAMATGEPRAAEEVTKAVIESVLQNDGSFLENIKALQQNRKEGGAT